MGEGGSHTVFEELAPFADTEVFHLSLPLFAAECFGSALVDESVLPKYTSGEHAPHVMRYEKGVWYTDATWEKYVATWLVAQPGGWMSGFVQDALARVEKLLKKSPGADSPEHVAHDVCMLHSTMAIPVLLCAVGERVLAARVGEIVNRACEDKGMCEPWMTLFRYPERETERLREREAFLRFAQFVKTHALTRPVRRTIDEFLKRYAYLGWLSPLGRAYTYPDLMKRVAQLSGIPSDIARAETKARAEALHRVKEFFSSAGLTAAERDVVRAYRDVMFWKLRAEELWAAIARVREQGAVRISGMWGADPALVWEATSQEFSHLAAGDAGALVWESARARKERGFGLLVTTSRIIVDEPA